MKAMEHLRVVSSSCIFRDNCVRRVHRDFSFIINIHYVLCELSRGTMKSDDSRFLMICSIEIETIFLRAIWCFYSNTTLIQNSNELLSSDLGFLATSTMNGSVMDHMSLFHKFWLMYIPGIPFTAANQSNQLWRHEGFIESPSSKLNVRCCCVNKANATILLPSICHWISFVRTSPSQIGFETVPASNRVSRNNSSKIRVSSFVVQ